MGNQVDTQYQMLMGKILEEGVYRDDRTGTGTISVFGTRMEFDLKKGFPILTTKKIPFRVVAEELLWFLSSSTNLKPLLDRNVNIWNGDAYRFYKEQGGTKTTKEFLEMARKDGFDLGHIYGKNMRRWEGEGGKIVDQIAMVISSLKTDPNSRRHVVTTWNPTVLDEIALPSCHGVAIQFYVENGKLSCQMYQRSGDFFLGVPFNITSYALLTHIIADMVGLGVGKLIHIGGDMHLYANHTSVAETQYHIKPKELPRLVIKNSHDKIEDYTIDDFELVGYNPHPPLRAPLSVGL